MADVIENEGLTKEEREEQLEKAEAELLLQMMKLQRMK